MLFRSVLGCLLAVFPVVPCSAPPSIFDPPEENYLRIGVKYDQPGTGCFEYEKYSGFDVDLACWLAANWARPPS